MDIIVWPETMMIYVGTRQQIVEGRGKGGIHDQEDMV